MLRETLRGRLQTMSGGRKRNPDREAWAVAAVARGRSMRSVAAELGVAAPTVRRWLDAAEARGPAPEPTAPIEVHAHREADSEELPVSAPVDLASYDPLAELAQMAADLTSDIRAARTAGDMGRVSALMGTKQRLMPTIAAMRRARDAETDTISVPRDKFEAQRSLWSERIRAHRARQLLCARCGRELSSEWALVKMERDEK